MKFMTNDGDKWLNWVCDLHNPLCKMSPSFKISWPKRLHSQGLARNKNRQDMISLLGLFQRQDCLSNIALFTSLCSTRVGNCLEDWNFMSPWGKSEHLNRTPGLCSRWTASLSMEFLMVMGRRAMTSPTSLWTCCRSASLKMSVVSPPGIGAPFWSRLSRRPRTSSWCQTRAKPSRLRCLARLPPSTPQHYDCCHIVHVLAELAIVLVSSGVTLPGI